MMLSSLYSSLPTAAASAAVAAPAIKQNSSDEKRIVPLRALPSTIAKVFVPRAVTLQSKRGRKNQQNQSVVPRLMTAIRYLHKYRFLCTTGEAFAVTLGNLFGVCGAMGTVVNTTVTSICSSVRLRKIEVFESAQGVVTVNSFISFYEATDANSPDVFWSNSTIPYDRPTYVSAVPPRKSLASFWWNASATLSTVLVSGTVSIGSVVDVTVESTLQDVALGVNISVATSVLGDLYYLALDGPSNNKLQPVGLPTTH